MQSELKKVEHSLHHEDCVYSVPTKSYIKIAMMYNILVAIKSLKRTG